MKIEGNLKAITNDAQWHDHLGTSTLWRHVCFFLFFV